MSWLVLWYIQEGKRLHGARNGLPEPVPISWAKGEIFRECFGGAVGLPGGVGAVGMGDLAERLDRKKRMLP